MNNIIINKSRPAWFVTTWVIVTGLSWLLAHPYLQLILLETLPLWAGVLLLAVVAATSLHELRRKHSGENARWQNVAINAGWAMVAVVSLLLTEPGSIGGVLQWPILRRYITGSPRWILAGIVGTVLADVVSGTVVGGSRYFDFAVNGVVHGLTQWFVLRRQLTSAGWWILASTIGWLAAGFGIAAGQTLYASLSDGLSELSALVFAHTVPNTAGGVLYGLATGICLSMLLKGRRFS